MHQFKVVNGRLSKYYNHFAEFSFESCQATATRLDGRTAIKITWEGKVRYWDHYYQLVLLDCVDHRISEYYEFDCFTASLNCVSEKAEMISRWDALRSELGGNTVSVKPDALLRLLGSAKPCDEYVRERLELSMAALELKGYSAENCTTLEAAASISSRHLATCDTINYFVKRLVCGDIEGAAILSTMNEELLEQCDLVKAGSQKLIRNSIRISNSVDDPSEDGSSFPYRCEAFTELNGRMHFYSYVIWLNGDYTVSNPKITEIKIGTDVRLSKFEERMQPKTKEYIAVFESVNDSNVYSDGSIRMRFDDSSETEVPNGIMYTILNHAGSYMNKTEYTIDNECYGYALLTKTGELVLMSHNTDNIGELDYMMTCALSPHMTLTGRYNIEQNSAFDVICNTSYAKFKDVVQTKKQALSPRS